MSFLPLILIILCLFQPNTECYHVQCNYFEDTSTLYIVGLRTYEDFINYGIKCGDYNLEILIYEKCYLGKISLPLGDIIRNYPKLRTLYWRCDGHCDFSDTTITVVGCHSGNRYGAHSTPFI